MSSARFQLRLRGNAFPQAVLLLLAVGIAVGVGVAGEVQNSLSRSVEVEPAKAAQLAAADGGEVLHLRWRLKGFLGALAGLFVPNSGDALLTFVPRQEEQLEIQMLITAPKRDGEYFLYGAEVDRSSGSTAAVWSSYVYGDKGKDREQEIEEPNVIDYASAIYHLRRNPPVETIQLKIWDGGKIYPALVEPLETETRKINGQPLQVRGYEVRGAVVDGKPAFKDKIYLYFAKDSGSTPVEILGKRGFIKVQIQLQDSNRRGAKTRQAS